MNTKLYNMFSVGCPSGYAYVMDWMGNKCYYGPVNDCRAYIRFMTKEFNRIAKYHTSNKYRRL